MKNLFDMAFERMQHQAFNVYGLANLHEWIKKNTYLNQAPFSFKDREFQLAILADTAKTQIIVKCAQVGLSELAYRWAVAACCVMKNFTAIYTFPSTGDAEVNNRTRIDPMIEGSPELKRLVNPDMNNSSVKQFGENSFLFFKGTISKTAALSTPADAVINDEYDKSDIEQASVYVSRLQDRETKIHKIFSTPTFANYGVDKEARTANRMKHMVQCVHCNETFLPNYFTDIVIPGWDRPMEEITKENLNRIRYREAYLKCPKCGLDPQMHHTRMPFICENNEAKYNANAWFVSPFSAHKRLPVPYLVEASTKFKRYSEFKNQTLGITGEEESESITPDDVNNMQVYSGLESSELHQAGIDMGITCTISIGRETQDGDLLVVHRERVHYTKFKERLKELRRKYRLSIEVLDSQPYTDMVTTICSEHPNSWGGIFVTSKSPASYVLQEYDEDDEKARLALRLVKINRTPALDELLARIKSGQVKVNASEENDVFYKHMLCMKRKIVMDKNGDLTPQWVKTGDEEDHYHFSLLYLNLAIQMRKVAGTPGILSAGMMPLYVSKKPAILKRSEGMFF